MRCLGLSCFWALFFIHQVRLEQFDIRNADGNQVKVIFSEELQKFLLKPKKGRVITKYDFIEGKIGYLNFWEDYCIILPLDIETSSFQDHLTRLKSGVFLDDLSSNPIYVENSIPRFDEALCDRLPRYEAIGKHLVRSKRSVEDPNSWYYRRQARQFSGQAQSQLMRQRNCQNGGQCDEKDEATARATSDGAESIVSAGGNSMGQAQSQMFPWISPYSNNFGSGTSFSSLSRGPYTGANGRRLEPSTGVRSPNDDNESHRNRVSTDGQNYRGDPSSLGHVNQNSNQDRLTPFTDKHRYGAPGTVGGIHPVNSGLADSPGTRDYTYSQYGGKYVPRNELSQKPMGQHGGSPGWVGTLQGDHNGYTNNQDEEQSQASSQVRFGKQGSMASASSGGGYGASSTQSQVQGSYSGTGSFSGQSQSSGGWGQSSSSHIQAGPDGSSSQAGTSINSRSGSQTQVQVGQSGNSAINSQSLYRKGGSSTNLQANQRGGQAGAQATGEGATNSQAQISFQPGTDAQGGFLGGGQASAQSQGYMGQAQSQLFGNLANGKMYSGAAQAGSGTRRGQQGYPYGREVGNNGIGPNTYSNGQNTHQGRLPYDQNRRKQNNVQGSSANWYQPVDEHIRTPQRDYYQRPDINHQSAGQYPLDPNYRDPSSEKNKVPVANGKQIPVYQGYNNNLHNQVNPSPQSISGEAFVPQSSTPSEHPLNPPPSYPHSPQIIPSQIPTDLGYPSNKRPSYHQSQNAYVNGIRVQGRPEVRVSHSNEENSIPGGKIYEPGQQIPGYPGYQVPTGYRAQVISSESEGASASVHGPGQAQSQTLNINFPLANQYPSLSRDSYDQPTTIANHLNPQAPQDPYPRNPNPSLQSPYPSNEANQVPGQIENQEPLTHASQPSEDAYYDAYGNEADYYYDDIEDNPPSQAQSRAVPQRRPVVTPPPVLTPPSNVKGYPSPRPQIGQASNRGDIAPNLSSSSPQSQTGSTSGSVSSSGGTKVASKESSQDGSRCQGYGNNPCYNRPYSGSFHITGQGTYQFVPSSSGHYRSHSSTYGGHFKVRPSGENDNDDSTWQETNYSQASTCGYFTFSCNIALGSDRRTKICIKDPNQCNS